MLMMPGRNRNKMVTLIIGGMKPDFVQGMGESSGDGVFMSRQSNPEDDYSMALNDAGNKVMSALERRDVGAFVDYMQELVDLCQQKSMQRDEEMEY